MGEWIKVASKKDWLPGTSICVEAVGCRIALFNVGGSYYAVADTCTHRGGPLSEGEVISTTVTCPWHGAQFDLKTGAALRPPAPQAVENYEVLIEGDDIKIAI